MFHNVKQLPIPKGPFTVGTLNFDFLDESRPSIFEFDTSTKRLIPTLFFYPGEPVVGIKTNPYACDEAIKYLRESVLNLVSNSVKDMKTSTYHNIPLTNQISKFPILFFNMGYFGYLEQNTALCSELASHGYIVISVGHPYESGALKYTDGQINHAHPSLANEFKITMNKDARKHFSDLLKETIDDASIQSKITPFFDQFKSGHVWNDVKVWSDDTRFVSNKLIDLHDGTIPSPFKNRLDLSLGFGITGHSYGGCTAMQTLLDDERFKCGINMDAPTYGNYWDKDINKPLCILGSYVVETLSRTPYLNNSKESYLVKIDDTQHMDYTDHIFFAQQLKYLKLIGKRDMNLVHTILCDYHKAFFDHHLLGKETKMLDISFKGVSIRHKKDE